MNNSNMCLRDFRKFYTRSASRLRGEYRRRFEATYDHAKQYSLLDGIGHNLPRTLAELKAHPLVEEISDERGCGDGIWIYLVPGLIRHQFDPAHCVHEDTVAECLKMFAEVYVGCDCNECRRLARAEVANA